jgi:Flp pilus assembly protein TadD
MGRRVHLKQAEASDTQTDVVRRAHRLRRRGDQRRSMLVLREACFANANDARLWTIYGIQCLRAGRRDAAEHALRQALWYRQRNRDRARAEVTRQLLERLRGGALTLPLKAA